MIQNIIYFVLVKLPHFLCDKISVLLQFKGQALGYVQQIVVKAAVSPWKPDVMIPSDAYRSPLSTVFQLMDRINGFQFNDG